jgi:predicted PurR-regulated permease PerM
MAISKTNPDRLKRSRIFYAFLTTFVVSIIAMLLWTLNALILPIVIGLLSAYIAMPGLKWLVKHRIPKWLGIAILFGGFIFVVFILGRQVISMLPDEKEQVELRVNIQYKLYLTFQDFLNEESSSPSKDMLLTVFGPELTPILNSIVSFISLNEDEEKKLYQLSQFTEENQYPIRPSTVKRFEELKKAGYISKDVIETKEGTEKKSFNPFAAAPGNSRIAALLSAISNWILTPFVFIFILFDDGEIKHALLNLIPNRYFEMSLTTMDNADNAIGSYLRGTLTESTLVGLCFIIGLLAVGFEIQAAVLIGMVAGVANAIPFLGPVIGLVVGVSYAMIVENIDPLLPFLDSESAILGVVIVVILVQLLDNAYFGPVILGKAVNLHPLVVIIGVSGGSILFGFTGMLFAIPSIVMVNVIISTVYKQLKAYYIIY